MADASEFSAPFTRQYGALKGWQWAAILGSMTGVYLYLHNRNKAAALVTQSTPSTPSDPGANPGPSSILAPIIIQQGPGSTGKQGVPGPAGPPGPTPAPPKPQPNPGPLKVDSRNYSQTIAANSPTGKGLVSVGTVTNGQYKGKNSSSGAPVYALVGTGYGPNTSYTQNFSLSKLPSGTKLFTLPQFASAFK